MAVGATSKDMNVVVPPTMLTVVVTDLGGTQFEFQLGSSENVGRVRSAVCKAWESLDPKGIRLLAGATCLDDEVVVGSLESDPLLLQLVKFDPLPELGQFDAEGHRGIEVQASGDGCSSVSKTSGSPDSNNVFLRHVVQQPCFAEFSVVRSCDELSVGVTTQDRVKSVSGFGNMDLQRTWIYSKRQTMPKLLFGGKALNPEEVPSYTEGDMVAVFVDPDAGLVKFYKNGKLVASNLPDWPLLRSEDEQCRIYAMVDGLHDELAILRYGPGEPYSAEASAGA